MSSGMFPSPWDKALAGSPAIAVIDRAIERKRLSHSLLLTGDDFPTLEKVALGIADRLLNQKSSAAHFAPEQHPDCFQLRPSGKARIISADATRNLISKIQVSANVSLHKVAILHEADRMNPAAANIFLKTLEEPPGNTTLLLLTRRPYALLPTIRSRVLHFRFPMAAEVFSPAGWEAWIGDYRAWLDALSTRNAAERKSAAESVFMLYGLTARFSSILESASAEEWKRVKQDLPEDINDDEQDAIETGIANGLRTRLFAGVGWATRDFALSRLAAGDDGVRSQVIAAVDRLEHVSGLLRVNLNETAALEQFLLSSLRIWSRR